MSYVVCPISFRGSINAGDSKGIVRASLVRTLFLAMFLITTLGCEPEQRDRPYGYLRLLPVAQVTSSEIFLEDKWLMLGRDDQGISAMSTVCSKDLNSLQMQTVEGKRHWHCALCGSKFALTGEVIQGPAHAPLPYYLLLVDRAEVEGPVDTLYVRIGQRVAKEWRLRIHLVEDVVERQDALRAVENGVK
jgi:nitrite reductase/ring-hydroxylating ferredoxin subunit